MGHLLRSICIHLVIFIAITLTLPHGFKDFPFLILPALGIAVVLVMHRDFAQD